MDSLYEHPEPSNYPSQSWNSPNSIILGSTSPFFHWKFGWSQAGLSSSSFSEKKKKKRPRYRSGWDKAMRPRARHRSTGACRSCPVSRPMCESGLLRSSRGRANANPGLVRSSPLAHTNLWVPRAAWEGEMAHDPERNSGTKPTSTSKTRGFLISNSPDKRTPVASGRVVSIWSCILHHHEDLQGGRDRDPGQESHQDICLAQKASAQRETRKKRNKKTASGNMGRGLHLFHLRKGHEKLGTLKPTNVEPTRTGSLVTL